MTEFEASITITAAIIAAVAALVGAFGGGLLAHWQTSAREKRARRAALRGLVRETAAAAVVSGLEFSVVSRDWGSNATADQTTLRTDASAAQTLRLGEQAVSAGVRHREALVALILTSKDEKVATAASTLDALLSQESETTRDFRSLIANSEKPKSLDTDKYRGFYEAYEKAVLEARDTFKVALAETVKD